ncbi:amino acid adenylation domain-containing protein [Actinomadura montaniterrae]|uniref:Amino acid adenylation domain-containing protein n=1 Tax=Actinomadura montaniterrae TaxID=1803903 RepID=A0A6L3VRX7_9ACTN|nr:amino acid adenylation domain-containing protein [Actinomadura montaniterrae]KAB2379595.1 amino acid adenylation domain-containing protein [Actinomadura montaniterrae]
MSARGPAVDRLLPLDGLPVLAVPAGEADRARELAARHGLVREHGVDLADPLITRVERFAAERDRPAVADRSRSLSYSGLAAEARRLAALLEGAGVEPGTVVGVGGGRCAAVVAAFLAIELVGALYVPADETWPAGRVRDVLDQAGASVLVAVDEGGSAPALLEGAAAAGCRVLRAADAAGLAPWAGEPRLHGLDRPRYVLFTSGSTGRPKGAVVEHQGMVNHLWAKIVDLGLTGDDVLAFTAPLGFDISIWQMLAPLLVGGRVDVIGDEVAHDPVAFARAVDEQGITVVELVPTMVRHLLDDLPGAPEGGLGGLRWMIATGEELPAELARRWLEAMPHARLLNAYGPTECSDDVTHHTVTAGDLDLLRLPIGTPVVNARLHVLREGDDGTWTACDVGETGELFVGGVAVGRGYLGNDERTREAFYRDPFGASPTGRLYRTGDAVRLLPAGAGGEGRPTLQYLGRVDRQVKISGVRMELGEIEAVLQRHPGVRAAAVVVHEYRAR